MYSPFKHDVNFEYSTNKRESSKQPEYFNETYKNLPLF